MRCAALDFLVSLWGSLSIAQFNGLDIGDGYVISVTRAEFGNNSTASTNADPGTGSGTGTSTGGTLAAAANKGKEAPHAHEGRPSSYFVHGQSVQSAATKTAESALSTQHQQEIAALCAMLPTETEAGVYPVALLMNAFDCQAAAQAEEDTGFFDELEVTRRSLSVWSHWRRRD